MRPGDDDAFPETRAEVARRRLALLAASFDDDAGAAGGGAPAPPTAVPDPAPTRGRRRAGPSAPRLAPTHVRLVATAAVAAGVLLAWWLLAERPHATEVAEPLRVGTASSSAPVPGATSEGGGAVVVVDVAGKVRKPGIVTLPAGSRVYEAIDAAGGVKGTVEDPGLNFARKLVDGEQVLVGVAPAVPDPAAPATGPGPAGTGARVDLNTATAEQLDALPGVGPVTAKAILDWRAEHGRFSAVEDLLEVTGIGDKTLEDLRDLVAV